MSGSTKVSREPGPALTYRKLHRAGLPQTQSQFCTWSGRGSWTHEFKSWLLCRLRKSLAQKATQSKCFNLHRNYLNLSVKQLSTHSLPKFYKWWLSRSFEGYRDSTHLHAVWDITCVTQIRFCCTEQRRLQSYRSASLHSLNNFLKFSATLILSLCYNFSSCMVRGETGQGYNPAQS